MDENQKGNSSSEEDDLQETEASCVQTFMAETSSFSKISGENLKRKPLLRRIEEAKSIHEEAKSIHEKAKLKGPCLNLTENKEKKVLSTRTDFLVKSSFYSYILLGSVIFILIGYILWEKPSPSLNKQLDVQKLMSELRSRFDGQPSLTYHVIEVTITKASSESSKSPGIIILISSRKAQDTTNQLANSLVQLVSDPLNSVLIDLEYFSTAKQHKKKIDDTLRGNLTEKQMRAVLVKNLDQIPFEAAMMFHNYCDHENAPFKRVVYVMTTFVEETISPASDGKQWDTLASKHLKAAWSDSKEDQVASLISRLTVNVAAVVSGKE